MPFLLHSLLRGAFLATALAVEAPKLIRAEAGADDRYIVALKSGVNPALHLAKISDVASTFDGSQLLHVTTNWTQGFVGYAATLKGAALDAVLASEDVEFVEEDGLVEAQAFTVDIAEEFENGTEDRPLVRRQGAGVNIYSVDTGIFTAHVSFGGRASWGTSFGGYANADGNGHGTFVASLAGGNPYSTAPQSNLFAVKVLSDSGSGTFADVVSGINWAAAHAFPSGVPCVILLTLGGSVNTSVDSAVISAIQNGCHVVVGAGNSNIDAINFSPGRVAAAITVGASTSSGTRASFSNYGAVVDCYALGQSVLGAYIGSTTATATLSGAQIAAAKVAGYVAAAIAAYGNKTPAEIASDLLAHTTLGAGGIRICQPW